VAIAAAAILSVGTLGGELRVAAQGTGLSVYPGAKPNPSFAPLKTPQMTNEHLIVSAPFEKVLAWYVEKLDKITRMPSGRGDQAMWREKLPDGGFRTVIVSTVDAPRSQVKVTLTKGGPMR
jgi:hypothetical protein